MRRKKIEIPLKLVELEYENYHIMVESLFPDGCRGMWIVDTGASRSVLDINLTNYFTPLDTPLTEIESMGIGSQSVETKAGIIPSLSFGESILKNVPVALIDLSPLNQLYQKHANETITGLIGSDFLLQHSAVIDFKKMVIKITG